MSSSRTLTPYQASTLYYCLETSNPFVSVRCDPSNAAPPEVNAEIADRCREMTELVQMGLMERLHCAYTILGRVQIYWVTYAGLDCALELDVEIDSLGKELGVLTPVLN